MSRIICIADLYGLGGLSTSQGMLILAEKIRQLGKTYVVLGPYNQSDWQQAADDLARRPKSDLIGAIGYSLGANNVVQIAATLGRRVDYIAGIQPSFWGLGVDWSGTITLPANIGFARNVYNPNFVATFGLGFVRYAAPAGFAGRLQISTTNDLHPEVDDDAGVHGLLLGDLRKLAA